MGTEVLSRACLTIAGSGIRSMVYHWCAAAVVQHCPLLSWLAPTRALAGTGTLWTASQPCSKGFSLAYALMRTGGTPGIFQETLCGHTRCSAGTCAKLPCAPPPRASNVPLSSSRTCASGYYRQHAHVPWAYTRTTHASRCNQHPEMACISCNVPLAPSSLAWCVC